MSLPELCGHFWESIRSEESIVGTLVCSQCWGNLEIVVSIYNGNSWLILGPSTYRIAPGSVGIDSNCKTFI